jgi:hypothetical protein
MDNIVILYNKMSRITKNSICNSYIVISVMTEEKFYKDHQKILNFGRMTHIFDDYYAQLMPLLQ